MCPHASSSSFFARTGSTRVVLAGGAPLATRHVRRLPGLGCVKMLTANCGIISARTTSREEVPMYGVPTCNSPSMTRVMFTLLLTVAGHARCCTRRGQGKH